MNNVSKFSSVIKLKTGYPDLDKFVSKLLIFTQMLLGW